jgi:hypothetical protein
VGYCRFIESKQTGAPAAHKETNMYQPGMDQGLAQIRYAEVLEEAAQERVGRQAQSIAPNQAARRLVLAFAAVVPVALAIVWVFAAH